MADENVERFDSEVSAESQSDPENDDENNPSGSSAAGLILRPKLHDDMPNSESQIKLLYINKAVKNVSPDSGTEMQSIEHIDDLPVLSFRLSKILDQQFK